MITRWGLAGLLGLIVLGGGLASAQEWNTLQNTATPGNGAELDVSGYHSVSIVVEMASTGTVQFKVKGDGSYANLACTDLSDAAGGLVTSVTASKNLVCSTGGMTKIQTPIAAAGGNITVKAKVSNVIVSRGGGGGGGGGGVTTDIQDGAGDSVMDAANNAVRVNIVAGAGSGGTAMTDDAAFTAGTTSVTPFAGVFDNTSPDSVDEGDAGAVRMSANRNLFMNIRDAAGNERGVNVNASNQMSVSVDNTVTVGSHAVTNAGTFAVQVDGNALTALQLIDNIVATEDAAHSDGEGLVKMGCRRKDTAATSSGTDGDWSTVDCVAGALRVYLDGSAVGGVSNDDDGSIASGGTGHSTVLSLPQAHDGSAWVRQRLFVGIEDAAETDGIGLSMAGAVRRDTAASSAGTTGDNATINTDALGLLWTRRLDPCSGVAKTHIPINISTATTTEITPSLAGASTHYYVCSIDIVTAASNNVALVDDDSDGCGSPTSGLAGGTTAASGWNFAANGGLTKGNGDSMVFKTGGTNRVLCLVTSATTQLSGSIQVVAAP